MADLTERRLRALNPGYLGSRIPEHSPGQLLLPATAADALATALTVKQSESVAQVETREQDAGPSTGLRLPGEQASPLRSTDSAAPARQQHRHVVRKGETLWSIAHRYHVTVGDLKRWNHLNGDDIRPGEELRVRG
jgi:membrane-bound lytic murein transglycosylase D